MPVCADGPCPPSLWLPQKWVCGQCTAAQMPLQRLPVPARCVSIELQLTPHRTCRAPDGFARALWPFKKAYRSRFPGGKNKEASGSDVILQCRADCVSLSAGSWGLSRVKQGEAAWGLRFPPPQGWCRWEGRAPTGMCGCPGSQGALAKTSQCWNQSLKVKDLLNWLYLLQHQKSVRQCWT